MDIFQIVLIDTDIFKISLSILIFSGLSLSISIFFKSVNISTINISYGTGLEIWFLDESCKNSNQQNGSLKTDKKATTKNVLDFCQKSQQNLFWREDPRPMKISAQLDPPPEKQKGGGKGKGEGPRERGREEGTNMWLWIFHYVFCAPNKIKHFQPENKKNILLHPPCISWPEISEL